MGNDKIDVREILKMGNKLDPSPRIDLYTSVMLEDSSCPDNRSLKLLTKGISEAKKELVATSDEFERKAYEDSLTGLGNRRFYNKRIQEEISSARRYGTDLSLFIADIDHFKKFNDSYGHCAGDDVLRKVGGIFKNNLKDSDVIVRYGGEEIVSILPDTCYKIAFGLAKRVNGKVCETPMNFYDKSRKNEEAVIEISVGVAFFDVERDGEKSLFKRADERLYLAKNLGRNRVVGRTTN